MCRKRDWSRSIIPHGESVALIYSNEWLIYILGGSIYPVRGLIYSHESEPSGKRPPLRGSPPQTHESKRSMDQKLSRDTLELWVMQSASETKVDVSQHRRFVAGVTWRQRASSSSDASSSPSLGLEGVGEWRLSVRVLTAALMQLAAVVGCNAGCLQPSAIDFL